MIAVIGLKMESSLCHRTKKQFVFNECFFFFLVRLVKNNITSKHRLTAKKRGVWMMESVERLALFVRAEKQRSVLSSF